MLLQLGAIPTISPQSISYFLTLVVPNLVSLFSLAFEPFNIKSCPSQKSKQFMVPRFV